MMAVIEMTMTISISVTRVRERVQGRALGA